MNAPLLPTDNILQIVPGSHTRESTAEEVAAAIASRSDPHGVEMPGAVTVKLEAGDAAYYDFTIWCRPPAPPPPALLLGSSHEETCSPSRWFAQGTAGTTRRARPG